MRILVINLTRFGDLLQTQPVISGLKAQGHEVGLMCLENFAPAVELMRDVDHTFSFPGAALLARLDDDWRESLSLFWQWGGDELRSFAPHRVLNLTATLPGRLLSSFAASEVQGFGIDDFGFAVNSSPWAAFLQVSSRNRGCSPYNLVDQFWRVSGLCDGDRSYRLAKPAEGAKAQMRDRLQSESHEKSQGYVALQLGASDDRRRWPIGHFAALAERIWQEHGLIPVLLGTKIEAPLGQRFAQEISCPHIDLIGATTLVELAAVLTEMRLLVTNDTGTMHLAAGLGTPVCAVFLVTAQPWDTGPYAPGCLCVEADLACHPCGFRHRCQINHACRSTVTAEALYHYIQQFIVTGRWEAGASIPAGIRVWATAVQPDGAMGLESLSGHDIQDRTSWVRLQRHFYRQFLDEQEPTPPHEVYPLSDEMTQSASRVLEQAGQLLFLMGEQVSVLARTPVPMLRNKFLGNFERVTALLADDYLFSVLGDMWRQESQSMARDFTMLSALIKRYSALVEVWRQCLS
ncbi:glycosyltransferase family 9 protein [Desulfovibrio ferrophilus]|uniref:glycosyltransferase family 9 protein n=1 Tax=Desulfovibrio ferrophilus TaxID=241368 RepID=UPI000F81BDCB|nr:glycosyltransferase family 9 protein [Desulfovibrio ferrophilus]